MSPPRDRLACTPVESLDPPLDAVVVGAGIIGAACARELLRDGRRVCILESDVPGGGVSARSQGHLIVLDDTDVELALLRYSNELWADVLPSLPEDCEVDFGGTLWVASTAREMAIAEAKVARLEAAGVEAELLGARALAMAEPRLRPGLAGGFRVPGDSVLYPPAVVRWLLARAIEDGATLVAGRVSSIGERHVVADGRSLGCELIVNAAGIGAAELMPTLPITPRRGHLVITDRYPGFVRRHVMELGYFDSAHGSEAASVAFNTQPRRTGQLLIGSSREFVGLDTRINPAVRARMLARACEFIPDLARLSVLRTWVGFRPATPDNLPLIGAWPALPGVWVAAGHEGLGITTALATGRLLADLVAGTTPAIDAAPFDPVRPMTPGRAPSDGPPVDDGSRAVEPRARGDT